MTQCTPSVPLSAFFIRVLRPGDTYLDYLDRSQPVGEFPLVEFYALGRPTELWARYRWDTLKNYTQRLHGTYTNHRGEEGIQISAEELEEMGGDPIHKKLLEDVIAGNLENTGPFELNARSAD